MPRIKGLAQRFCAWLKLTADREYAQAACWRARCMRSDQTELRRLQLPLRPAGKLIPYRDESGDQV